MSTKTSEETIWHAPDDLWSLIAPLFGPEKAPGTPGRPAVPFRRIFDGIIDVLRTGCQWRAIPREQFAPKSTLWGRFQPWVEAGVFQQVAADRNHGKTYGVPTVGGGGRLPTSLGAGARLLRPGSRDRLEVAGAGWGDHQSAVGRRGDRPEPG